MAKRPSLAEATVLVIDDNLPTRELLRKLLDSCGVKEVLEAANGFDGLSLCGRKTVDAIICDIKMAPINGIEFVRKLRAGYQTPDVEGGRPGDRNIPVIMLTAHTLKPLVEQARVAGANAFLAKPVSPKLLKERLERLVLISPPQAGAA